MNWTVLPLIQATAASRRGWAALLVGVLACNGGAGDTTDTSAGTTEAGTIGASTTTGESTTTDASTTGPTEASTGSTVSSTGAPTSSSATDTGAPAGACDDAADCQLVNDCCQCAAHPVDAPVARCPMDCLIGTCESIGLHQPEAACRLGVCAIGPQSCDVNLVACDEQPPACAGGLVPSVVAGCWGACIPARHCDVLPSCSHDLCGPGWMCVEGQSGSIRPHCEPVPSACDGVPGCNCASPAFSEICDGGCSDDDQRLLCTDGG